MLATLRLSGLGIGASKLHDSRGVYATGWVGELLQLRAALSSRVLVNRFPRAPDGVVEHRASATLPAFGDGHAPLASHVLYAFHQLELVPQGDAHLLQVLIVQLQDDL
jgi:hypothetical protein